MRQLDGMGIGLRSCLTIASRFWLFWVPSTGCGTFDWAEMGHHPGTGMGGGESSLQVCMPLVKRCFNYVVHWSHLKLPNQPSTAFPFHYNVHSIGRSNFFGTGVGELCVEVECDFRVRGHDYSLELWKGVIVLTCHILTILCCSGVGTFLYSWSPSCPLWCRKSRFASSYISSKY